MCLLKSILNIFHVCVVAIVVIVCDGCICGTIDVIIIRFLFQFDVVQVVELMIGEHGPDTVVSHIGNARILACR